jgi:uncharacterized protein (DUF58 family)
MAAADLIPADVRARLKPLRLSAQRASGAFGFGLHQSRQRGAGLEFAQYRSYEPGDEPRQIDWKLYARSDKFFVREAERDSPLTLWVLVDASASMGQSDAARPEWSRLAAARSLAACAIELAVRQGERFGLIAVGGGAISTLVPAASGPRQRDRCLLELQRLQASGAWPPQTSLRPLWERIGAGALVLLLSDCFDDTAVELAQKLAGARREVLSVQILTVSERDFAFAEGQRFVDPETGAELITDAPAARAEFLRRFATARAELAQRLAASGIRHCEWVLDQPLDQPLQRFFSARGQRASRASP